MRVTKSLKLSDLRLLSILQMVGVKGFEPENSNTQRVDSECGCEESRASLPQIAPQSSGIADPELARIVEKWGQLPAPIRKALVAVFDSAWPR